MKPSESIKSITYMKTQPAALLKSIQSTGPVIVTQNGEPKAVIQDFASYQRQKDILLLLKVIALGEKEIKAKVFIEQDVVFAKMKKKLF